MKNLRFYTLLFFTLLSGLLFSCSGYAGAALETGVPLTPVTCLPPELTIKNISEYILLDVYVHDTKDYRSEIPVGTNVPIDGEIAGIVLSPEDRLYITFTRQVTSTSSKTIGITTQYPLVFLGCFKYTLNILEENFYIEKEGGNIVP